MALARGLDQSARARTRVEQLRLLDRKVVYMADYLPSHANRGRFAIIPSKGNRNDNLVTLTTKLWSENIVPYVIDTSEDAVLFDRFLTYPEVTVIPAHAGDIKEINISRWWMLGLHNVHLTAQNLGFTEWDVAILNDDCLPDFGWFDRVSTAMRRDGSFAACSGTSGHKLTVPGPVNLWYRMTGWAFIIAGESALRPDSRQRWWYSDDAIDWSARKMGGMTMVASGLVPHFHPNGQMTPELQVIAAEDRARFIHTWGEAPF